MKPSFILPFVLRPEQILLSNTCLLKAVSHREICWLWMWKNYSRYGKSLCVSLFVSLNAGISFWCTKKILSQNNVAGILILLEMRSVLLFLDVLHIQAVIFSFWQQLVSLHKSDSCPYMMEWILAFKVTNIWLITCNYCTLTTDIITL